MAIVQDLTPGMTAAAGSTGVVAGGVGVGMALDKFGGRRFRGMTGEVAGGTTGVGVPVVLRETIDEDVGPLVGEEGTTLGRVWRPSAAWGIFGGLTTAGLWWADGPFGMDFLPDEVADFFLWHGITGVPTGAVSAVMPKQSGGGGGGGGQTASEAPGTRRLEEVTDGGSSESTGGGESEFPGSGSD